MEVGVISMYTDKNMHHYITDALLSIGYQSHVIHFDNPTDVYNTIKNSTIKKWIFSGSSLTVNADGSPQVPLKIFNIKNKEFLLICYSMESALYQLKISTLKKRYENKKEDFNLNINIKLVKELNKEYLLNGLKNPMKLYRNHHWYFKANIKSDMFEIAKYRGESMMIIYKNTIMTQFHPERTDDGILLIKNWLN
jgi:GMP synthase-like glutamine amidotransferase